MKKTLTLLTLFLSILVVSDAQITFNRIGCTNQATVTLPSFIQVRNDLFTATQMSNCPGNPRFIGVSIGGVYYELQKKVGTSWVYVTSGAISSHSYTFSNLQTNTTYRVYIKVRKSSGGLVNYNTCNIVGQWYNNVGDDSFSPELEFVNTPVPSTTLIDFSGTPMNDRFCYGSQFIMDGNASFGETAYQINIGMYDAINGNLLGWGTSPWKTGRLGYVDLLNEVWKLNNPNWDFWPGLAYRVHVVYQNDCTSWLNHLSA